MVNYSYCKSKGWYCFTRKEDGKSFYCDEQGNKVDLGFMCLSWEQKGNWLEAPSVLVKAAKSFFDKNPSKNKSWGRAVKEWAGY